MDKFFERLASGIGVMDIIDILLVAFLIYKLLGFIRETRAEQLAKGILVLVAVTLISQVAHLYTLHWILSELMTVGVLALVIIFQPELRRLLENLGRSKFTNFVKGVDKDEAERLVIELAAAVREMSDCKTGALIAVERETALTDIIETGTVVDARITKEALENIFYEGAPLHDGAMIVRGNRIHAAGCVLPLTSNKNLSKELGTRHRAGIGLSECSDAYVIIVSEETGVISVAENGKLHRFIDEAALKKALYDIYFVNPQESFGSMLSGKFTSIVKGAKDGEEK